MKNSSSNGQPLLAKLAELSTDILLVLDEANQIMLWNHSAERTFGYFRGEAIGRKAQDLGITIGDKVDSLRVAVQNAEESDSSPLEHSFEQTVPSKDGRETVIEWTLSPHLQNGHCLIACVGRSTYERKRAESEKLLSRAQEIAHIGSWKLDIATNRLTWSDEVYRIFGCEPQEFATTYEAFLDFVHPDDRAAVDEMYSRSLREGADSYEIEHRIVRRNSGAIRHVLERCVHEHNDAGAVIQSTGMVQDITERKQAEESLRTSEERFRKLAEQSGTFTWEVDVEGLYTYMSPVSKSVLGYCPDEIVGRKYFYDLHPEAGREEFKQAALAVFERKEAFLNLPNAAQRKDGRQIWLSTNGIPILSADGTLQGYRGSDTDITERKQTEDALREAQERIRTILDTVGDPIFVKDNDHRIVLANVAFFNIFGLDENAVMGKTLAENVPADEREHFLAVDRQVLDFGVPDLREETLTVGDFTHTIITRKTRFVEISGKRFLVGSIHDITERKLAEEALTVSQQRLQSLADVAPVGIYLTDENGKCSYANRRWCEMAGMTIEEAVGDGWIRGLHPEDRQKVASEWQHMVDSNGHWGLEYRFQTPDGVVTWVQGVAAPIRDADGKITGYVGCNTDISERKQAENAIKNSRDYAENLIRTANAIVVQLDSAGEIVIFNKAAEEITGYTFEDLKGRNWFEVLVPRDRYPYVWKEFTRLTEGGVPKTFENPILTKSGEERVISWQNGELTDQGKVFGVFSFGIDITERKQAEVALREKDIRLDKLSTHVSGMLYQFMMKPDGTFCVPFTTQGIRTIFGCSPQDVSEDFSPIASVIHPEDYDRVVNLILDSARNLSDFYCEYRVQVPNQSIRWLWGNSSPEKLADGSIVWHGYNADITERKLAEAELSNHHTLLRDSEERYRLLVENTLFPVIVTSLVDNRVLFANDFAAQFFGFSSKTAVGQYAPDFWCDVADRERIIAMLKNGAPVTAMEVRLRTQSGEEKAVLISTSRIEFGGIPAAFSVIADITKLKQAEEALRKSQEQYELAVRGSTDGLWDWNLRENTLYLAPRWKEQLGFADDELPNEFATFESLLHPDDKTRVMDFVQRYFAGEIATYENEFRLRHRDGSYHWILARGKELRDENGLPYRMAGSHTDITKRKQVEEALRTSEERNRLLFTHALFAIAVHEIVLNEVGQIVDYVFLSANPAFETQTGLKVSDIIGRKVTEVLPGIEKTPFIEIYGKVVLTGKSVNFEQYSEQLRRFFLISAFKIGEKRFATSFTDITEHKVMERALEHSYAELEASNDYAPVMMCLLDEERNVLRANRAMIEFVGHSLSEFQKIRAFGLLGCVFSLDHPDGCGFGPHCKQCSVRNAFADTLETGNSLQGLEREFTLLRNGREERFVFSISCSLMNVGTDRRLLLYLQDITEVTDAVNALKKSSEQLRQLNAHVDSVLEADRKWVAQEIHDDLGQLLTALKMDLAWTKKRIPEDSKTLSDKLEAMANLTDSAMISVRKIAARLRPIPLEAMGFTEAIEWLVKEIAEHSELAYAMDLDMGGRIFSSKQCTTLYRILQESFNNVVRHAEATHVQIDLHTNQESIILQVKDNGRGIDCEKINAFSSIGLTGMRERARFLGGDVKIELGTLGGTIVTAQIPLIESEVPRD